MGKVYLSTLENEPGHRVLIADGKMLVFTLGSRFVRESPVSYYLGTLQEIDVISVLVSGLDFEVALHNKDGFSKHRTARGLNDTMNYLKSCKPFFTGLRNGELDGVAYTQYLFVFMKDQVITAHFQQI